MVSNARDGEGIPLKIIADKDYFDNKKIAYFIVRDFKEKRYIGKDKNVKKGFYCKLELIEKNAFDKENDYDMVIKIKHENSRQNVELQALDLISGSIFQEIENKDKTYTNILRKHNKKIEGFIRQIVK
ncbi:hypothetical protein BMS3Abin17_00603 [archaeon BMS3Abin17]|nr:hypothetical protein BMS3Abin17_00603 [archaeon BMS3Abin17]